MKTIYLKVSDTVLYFQTNENDVAQLDYIRSSC